MKVSFIIEQDGVVVVNRFPSAVSPKECERAGVSRGGKVEQVLPTEAREVFDVSGAGDTVIAFLTAALASGTTPVEAARIANLAAGVVVSKMGTATVSREELAETDKNLC